MIFFIVAMLVFLHNSLVWVWYLKSNNPSVMDMGWASGLCLAGVAYLSHVDLTLRSEILGLGLILWGLRLFTYLWYTRIRYNHVDKRYIGLTYDWKISKPLGFFINFQLQGLFILIISLPWYFISNETEKSLSLLDVIGMILFFIGLFLETLSDLQLTRFKKEFPGQVCNQRLWKYSRHPNYFFEWLVWCAFALFAFSLPLGVIAIISPLCLYLIMTRITIPMTEQGSIRSKGETYIQYQRNTPVFFPVRFNKI